MSTKIEWCDETINPIQSVIKGKSGRGYHCTKISPGCANCYAESINRRFGNALPYNADQQCFELVKSELDKPARWKKPRKIFVQSMGDLFHEDLNYRGPYLREIFRMITSEDHVFQILTKRPERMKKAMEYLYGEQYDIMDVGLENTWLGVTVCTPDELWKVGKLLDIQAAVRFVSLEPLLAPIDFTDGPLDPESTMGEWSMLDGIDLVIVGGETGPKARPMHPDWVRSIRDQCQMAGVPFFFKGWGEWFPWPNWSGIGKGWPVEKVGKKKAGRLLDGHEWNEFPE